MVNRIYQTADATYLSRESRLYRWNRFSFDSLFSADDPVGWIEGQLPDLPQIASVDLSPSQPMRPPIENQEVWAAGVTYTRSREARMEESQTDAGGDFYDKVYSAARPELFFKATARRVVGHGEEVALRSDSDWNVPEAELTIAINHAGRIFGYTIGNDMSSRSIEGENPLYLPQAKIYRRSASLGPCLLLSNRILGPSTRISLKISRENSEVFHGETSLAQMKRKLPELAHYLFRDNPFPQGAYLMTGTGIVPEADFTLHSGDVVTIEIESIGVLSNQVARAANPHISPTSAKRI